LCSGLEVALQISGLRFKAQVDISLDKESSRCERGNEWQTDEAVGQWEILPSTLEGIHEAIVESGYMDVARRLEEIHALESSTFVDPQILAEEAATNLRLPHLAQTQPSCSKVKIVLEQGNGVVRY
jgi:hypothetical protein